MTITLSRRGLFGIGAALVAAPAIVRVSSLMAVKPLPEGYVWGYYRGGAMNDMPPYGHEIVLYGWKDGKMIALPDIVVPAAALQPLRLERWT